MTRKDISKKILKAYLKKNITPYRVKIDTGVKENVFLSMLNGDANYTIDSYIKICNYLKIR